MLGYLIFLFMMCFVFSMFVGILLAKFTWTPPGQLRSKNYVR